MSAGKRMSFGRMRRPISASSLREQRIVTVLQSLGGVATFHDIAETFGQPPITSTLLRTTIRDMCDTGALLRVGHTACVMYALRK